jgi:ABC-type antimicrobial peptide transport system permease subunit
MGRDIDWNDREGAQRVAIVNEAFAAQYYGNQNPLGKALGIGGVCPEQPDLITVVGIVGNSKPFMRNSVVPTVYLPFRQAPDTMSFMTFVLRVPGDPSARIPIVRQVLREFDSSVPVVDTVSETFRRDQLISQERLLSSSLIAFGGVALLLACLGIYGMLAYAVSRRTGEIGIRMALGGRQRDIRLMILVESLNPVFVGVVIGVVGSVVLTKLVEDLLFGITRNDPLTIIVSTGLFLALAVIAAMVSARRAARIEPLIALRHE